MHDDCQLVQEIFGINPHLVLGGNNLHKITYPGDLAILESLVNQQIPIDARKVVIMGGSGGIATAIGELLKENHFQVFNPGIEELDVSKLGSVRNYFKKTSG